MLAAFGALRAVVLDQECEDVVRIEARVRVLQRDERADHQPRPDEQHERERHLRDHRAVAQPASRRAAASRAAERRTSITSGREPQRGSTPKSAPRRTPRRAVKASTVPRATPMSPAAGPPAPADQRVDAELREQQAGRAADRREHEALGDQLAHDRQRLPPIAARTASSRSRADARTRSRLATFAHAISNTNTTAPINATSCGRTSATRSSCIGSMRRFMFEVSLIGKRDRRSADSRSSSGCACSNDTPGFTLADHAQRNVVARSGFEVDAARDQDVGPRIDVGARRKQDLETRREHADDLGAAVAAERDRLPDNRCIAAEAALPEFVADDRDVRKWGGGCAPGGGNASPTGIGGGGCGVPSASAKSRPRLNLVSEQAEEVRRDRAARYLLRFALSFTADSGSERRDRGKAVEQRRVLPHSEEIAGRQREVLDVPDCAGRTTRCLDAPRRYRAAAAATQR